MIIFILYVDVLLKTPKTTDVDTLFQRGSSAVVSNCPKMGQSQRGVEEGSFESGGVE